MSRGRGPKVVVVQAWLTPYRLPFYELLRRELAERSIELSVIYGQADRQEATKGPATALPWGHYVPNRYLRLGGREVSWQPCRALLEGADLVIVEQALKRVLNLVLLSSPFESGPKVALWGHGKSFQPHRAVAGAERVKRYLSRRAHWWFAYNELSARAVQALPFPGSRTTVVNNSVDTRALDAARRQLSEDEVSDVASRLGVQSANVALYVGGMYPDKRLAFLLECCDRIRDAVPDFEMIFVGAGPEAAVVESAARRRPWLHMEGARFGPALAPYFALARLVVMPGVVGLVVLDCFAFGVPLVTCDLPYHGPEIDYVEPGVNAVVVADAYHAERYADAVAELLRSPVRRAQLEEGCREAAALYTVESMAQRFAGGVEQALGAA